MGEHQVYVHHMYIILSVGWGSGAGEGDRLWKRDIETVAIAIAYIILFHFIFQIKLLRPLI